MLCALKNERQQAAKGLRFNLLESLRAGQKQGVGNLDETQGYAFMWQPPPHFREQQG
jgi:hypothetical protein